ncbi:Beta protein [Burkholderia sp. OK233]|nr:Beta protein [Burkholderia sp. OK233]
MYTPILRNRQSEVLAFKGMPAELRAHMAPLLDVAAPTKSADQAKAEKYVTNNIVRIGKQMGGFGAVFVDSSELDPSFRLPGNLHPLVAASAAIAGAGSTPIPVTGLHRDDSHHEAVRSVMRSMIRQRICIRLDVTDVSTARLSLANIRDFLQSNAIETAQTYLLFDLQGLYDQDPVAVVVPVNRLLALLGGTVWAGIMIGGYSIPDQLSVAVQTNEQAYLPRIEQDVFNRVNAGAVQTSVWFADYTILPPSVVELDWRLISRVMTPKALYTLGDSWLIVRGSAFSSHPDGYAQYYGIAGEIVALDEYSGEGYSVGDDYIAGRALRVGKPGSPGSWITACVNHHMVMTARAHSTAR